MTFDEVAENKRNMHFLMSQQGIADAFSEKNRQ